MSNILKKKVLFADDDEGFRFAIKEYFSDSVWTIEFAENGVVALDMALSNQYDLIIMDVNMPFMKGSEAAKDIKNFNSKIPIIAFTAITDSEQISKLKNDGFDEIISKPSDFKTLHMRMKFFLEKNSIKTSEPVIEISKKEELPPSKIEEKTSQLPPAQKNINPIKRSSYISLINKSKDDLIKIIQDLEITNIELSNKISELDKK
ncbi:MAG: DNA-binding response regulator RprY [uncultured bacterium]|nr:MAG: DNA-binding response regulator RprY [uncultured bacterium]